MKMVMIDFSFESKVSMKLTKFVQQKKLLFQKISNCDEVQCTTSQKIEDQNFQPVEKNQKQKKTENKKNLKT